MVKSNKWLWKLFLIAGAINYYHGGVFAVGSKESQEEPPVKRESDSVAVRSVDAVDIITGLFDYIDCRYEMACLQESDSVKKSMRRSIRYILEQTAKGTPQRLVELLRKADVNRDLAIDFLKNTGSRSWGEDFTRKEFKDNSIWSNIIRDEIEQDFYGNNNLKFLENNGDNLKH